MPLSGTSDQRQYPSDFFTGGSLAYLIGMNGYRFVPALDSPKNDCLGLEQVLQDKHGFTTTTLFDTERQEVLDLLEQLKKECKPDSRLIFYYAGHGIADGADEENERPKGFLLAVDSERGKEETYVEMGHVLEVLVGLPCSHLLIILDCCYAGAIRYAEQTRSIGSSVPKTLYAEKFTYYISNPAKQVITSAACDQKAMDALGSRGELNAHRRSPFAESLIQNLERGDQDWHFRNIQPDGIITASEMGYFLSMEVSDRLSKNKVSFAEQQTPSVFRIGERTKGEFIFVSSQKAILQLKPNPKENPWKGLADYSINDNHLFYGRQRVLDGWWEGKTQYKGLLQLVSFGENTHKILVTGRSGSGKSSLVKAGVLARLHDESACSVTIITPGNTPFSTHSDLLKQLKSKNGKVYLMVDQYEELVTLCNDPIEQKDFENSLADLALQPDAKVIITLRSDLERRFVDSPFLDGEQGGDVYRFVVPPFSREEIREVVTQPAIQQLLEFRGVYPGANGVGDKSQDQADERFVNRVIDETFANPDSLPLLSFALNRLFEIKNPSPGNLLLETDYDDFGGISGILDKKLTDAYNAYDPGHQALFRQLIYRMISFDAGYMAKRRVYTTYISDGKILDELEFTDAITMTAMNAVQQELVKQRLLKTSRENKATGTRDDNVYFEPAHEALLRSSNLISQWQSEPGGAFQGRIILLNAISASAKNYYFYNGEGKKGSLWKDDPRLDLVKRMWDGRELYLNKIEETFIVESLRARLRAKRILWTVVITVIALLTIASIFSYRQKLQAQNQLAENYWSYSTSALASGEGLKSYLFLVKALDATGDTSALKVMRPAIKSLFSGGEILTGLINTGSDILSFEVSGDNNKVSIVSATSIGLWDIATQKLLFSVNGKLSFAHLSADGKKFYTGDTSGLTCWDIKRHVAAARFTQKNTSIKWLEQQECFELVEGKTVGDHHNDLMLDTSLKKQSALNSAFAGIYDGQSNFSGANGSVKLSWDFNEPYSQYAIYDSNANRYIIYGENGHLRICNSNGQPLGISFMSEGTVDNRNVGISGDGKYILSAAGSTLYIHERFPGRSKVVKDSLAAAYLSNDGKFQLLISEDSIASIRQNKNGKYTKVWNNIPLTSIGRHIPRNGLTINFNPDGSCLTINSSYSCRDSLFYPWLVLLDFRAGAAKTLCKNFSGASCLKAGGQEVLFGDSGYVKSYNRSSRVFNTICKIAFKTNGAAHLQPTSWSQLALDPDNDFLAMGVPRPDGYLIKEIDLHHPDSSLTTSVLKINSITGRAADSVSCVQYLDRHELLFANANHLWTYNFKSHKQTELIHAIRPVIYANLTADKRYILAFSSDQMFWMIDAFTRKVVHSFLVHLTENNADGSLSLVINADATILAMTASNLAMDLIDLSSGHEIFKDRDGYKKQGHFDSSNNYYYFSGTSLKEFGFDADEPAALFALEAAALTGSRLKPGDVELEGIPPGELVKIRLQYGEQAAEHYKRCRYKAFNLWRQMHPGTKN